MSVFIIGDCRMKFIISKRKGEFIVFNYINEINLFYLLVSLEYFIGSFERYVV